MKSNYIKPAIYVSGALPLSVIAASPEQPTPTSLRTATGLPTTGSKGISESVFDASGFYESYQQNNHGQGVYDNSGNR